MKFLFDRNMPEKLARMLGHFDREHTVHWLDDLFDSETPDLTWIPEAASHHGIAAIVSGDGRILSDPAEVQVLAGQPVSFFLFVPAWFDIGWHQMAWKAVKIWPQITMSVNPGRPGIWKVPISATKLDYVCSTADAGVRGRKRR